MVSEKKKYNEPYNVCSGKGISIGDYVELVKKIFNISNNVYVDPKRMRSSEVPLLIGMNDKIIKDTG